MFDDVEHQHQIEGARSDVGFVEFADEDALRPSIRIPDDRFVTFYAEDVAKTLKRIKKQPIAAADVQDSNGRCRHKTRDRAEENPLPNAPPPMISIQIPIERSVFGVHQSAPCTSATT